MITHNDLYAVDDASCSSTQCSSSADEEEYNSLDECLDAYSLAQYIRSQHNRNKRQRVSYTDEDLRPMAFVRLNTSLGKPSPVTIRALLDSGASESLVTAKYVKKLRVKDAKASTTVWTTPAGEMKTRSKVKAKFTIPELQEKRMVEWNFHVADDMGAYDMIIGRDVLSFLGIDIKFSEQVVEWDHSEMPFKPKDATVRTQYHVAESMAVNEATERIKDILDAKYEAADLNQVCLTQDHLNETEQQKLLSLLNKYNDLFDGTLGKWRHDPIELELKPDAEPFHARPYPVPRCHAQTLKMEVERLCQIGVLKRVN